MLNRILFSSALRRARRDGWTPARQQAFIDALTYTRNVGRAAAAVGLSRASAYRLRDAPGAEDFARAWAEAVARPMASRGNEIDAALNGAPTPYFYGGLQRGEYRRYDDRALIRLVNAALRARRSRATVRPSSPAAGDEPLSPSAVDQTRYNGFTSQRPRSKRPL